MYVLNPTATTKITKQGVSLGQKKDAKWNHETYSIDQKEDRKRGKKKQQMGQIETKEDDRFKPRHWNNYMKSK